MKGTRTDPHQLTKTTTMRGHNSVNLAKGAAMDVDATTDNHHHELGRHKLTKKQLQQQQNEKKGGKFGMLEEDINFSTAVWTTSNMNKLLGNNESANIEFQYLTPSTTTATTPTNHSTSSSADGNNTLRHLQRVQSQNNKNLMANNSTIKLLPDDEDEDKPCKQVSRVGFYEFALVAVK